MNPMDDNLVGYLLGALDGNTHRTVDDYLHADPDALRKLDRLRRALEPLEADRDEIEPPPGLALRTLARVAELPLPPGPAPAPRLTAEPPPARNGSRRPGASLPAGPRLTSDVPAGRGWGRRSDVLA